MGRTERRILCELDGTLVTKDECIEKGGHDCKLWSLCWREWHGKDD